MAPVKTLTEFSMRTITANLDSITSLGNLPYRLAKPILLLMSAEKLMEIERNSPHLKDDDQEIWENLCIERLGVKKDGDHFRPPKSWRKFYHVTLARQQQMEEDAGLRARNKYKALAAEKQEKRLVFTPHATPMKKARTNGWGRGSVSPKTLFDKARSDARRKAVIYSPASKTTVAEPPANAALLVQTPTRAINVTTTIKSAISPATGVEPPLPEESLLPSVPTHPLDGIDACPVNKHNPLAASKPPHYPAGRNPLKRPRGADALFMPKHAILPVSSRAR